jgi:protein-glutamine gamma-glutamyltransferase
MRALDIPARVVTGYQGGEQNPVDQYWVIKQGDAHAWAEVWIAGKGWVRIDPTSAVAPSRVEKGSQSVRFGKSETKEKQTSGWLSKAKFNADALANTWNQWVLNYDRNAQKRLMDKLGFDFTEWREVAGLFAAVLGLLIGVAALITLRPRLPKDPVERVWKNICNRLEDKGWTKTSSETAKQFLTRIGPDLNDVQRKAFSNVCQCYNKLRYEGETVKRKDVRHLRALAKQFKL